MSYASTAKWAADAAAADIELPTELLNRLRGIDELNVAYRAVIDTTSTRRAAVGELTDAALAGHGPGHPPAAAALDAHLVAVAGVEARRDVLHRARAAAEQRTDAWLREHAEDLVAECLRPKFAELLEAARHDRAHPPKPGDLHGLDAVEKRLDALSGIARLRGRLWDATGTVVDGAHFWGLVKDYEKFEDSRRIGYPRAVDSKLPPTISREWWRLMLDYGAQVWLPTVAEVTGRVAEHHEAREQRSRDAAATSAKRVAEQQAAANMATFMAKQARPKTPAPDGQAPDGQTTPRRKTPTPATT